MNWLQKIATVELYYHGTSGKNISTILSQGLITTAPKAWGTDDAERSRVSYGGIYLTKNLMTATSSAGHANQMMLKSRHHPECLVIVQVETKTPHILMDEDALPIPTAAINNVFHVNANDWYFFSWAHSDFADMDKVIDYYIDLWSYGYKIYPKSQGKSQTEDSNKKYFQYLRNYIKDYIVAYCKREMAIALKHDTYKRYHYDFPEWSNLTLEQTESEVRNTANSLSQKAHQLTGKLNADSTSYKHIRSMESIGYSGKNKIILVIKIEDLDRKADYYSALTIMYGNNQSAIQMLVQDYKSRVGPSFLLKDNNNNIYYDIKREKEPNHLESGLL